MKRFKLCMLLVALLALLLCACDPSTPGADKTDEGGDQIVTSSLTLVLPQMSQEDIDNLQEVIIYDDGVEIEHYYADTLPSSLRIVSSRAADDLVSAELVLDLPEGDYTISAKGIGYKGSGFELASTDVSITSGGSATRQTCESEMTSYLYLDCEAFVPYWGKGFITVDVTYSSGRKESFPMDMGHAKVALASENGTATISARLSDEALALGYSLEYEETITLSTASASQYSILVKNDGYKSSGKAITLKFDPDGRYHYFNSFITGFPKSEYTDAVQAERLYNTYG